MIHSKALFSVLAISVGLSFSVVDLGWSQDQTKDQERLQTQDQLREQDPTRDRLQEKEQLREQLKEKEMKKERLQERIHSQDPSSRSNVPGVGQGGMGQDGGMGQGGGMGRGGGR